MPRDDLSIDFVKSKMPQAEALDPGTILEDFVDRARNLPEEVRFMMDEVAEKDVQYNTCMKLIEDRENRIQKWIKANGSHTPNPKEEAYRQFVRETYGKAEKLSDEKIALHKRAQLIMDKHLRAFDVQIKSLYDRNEPGFQDPDELPSLLRPSAANHSAPSERSVNPAATHVASASSAGPSSATPSTARAANPQIRIQTNQPAHAASAPATPAASMIMNRGARESSAGPASCAPKRGPRANSGLGSLPATSSNLARHSSVGPGTPKVAAAAGPQRAGSAGPRATTKGMGTGPGRKAGTPSAGNRKKAPGGANKSSLARMKRPAKNSPSSTAESELSDAESASESAASSRRGTPARASQAADKEAAQTQTHPKTKRATAVTAGDDDEDAMDVDDDEAGDDKKYCLCQNVSFGDMVACDNDDCPYEWFHWSCVGLKSEPNGTWYCPVCSAKLEKAEGKVAGSKKGK